MKSAAEFSTAAGVHACEESLDQDPPIDHLLLGGQNTFGLGSMLGTVGGSVAFTQFRKGGDRGET